MPTPTPQVTVTDEQRLAVVREVWAERYHGGHVQFESAINAYERAAKERIERGVQA